MNFAKAYLSVIKQTCDAASCCNVLTQTLSINTHDMGLLPCSKKTTIELSLSNFVLINRPLIATTAFTKRMSGFTFVVNVNCCTLSVFF